MECKECGNTDLNRMSIVSEYGSGDEEHVKEILCEVCGSTWLSFENENNEFDSLTRSKA